MATQVRALTVTAQFNYHHMKTKFLIANAECKKLEKANTISAVFSTADMDRHGDIVMQNWDLENYMRNPVILNSHNSYDATEVIGKTISLSTADGRLTGEIEFAVGENPKAKVIYELYAGGFLNAFSVGFIPLEMDSRGIITRSELLEISAVSVPANQMALAKSKGIDVEALETPEPPVEVKEDETPMETPVVAVEAPQEAPEVAEKAVEDTENVLLKVVKQLCDEQKGRNLTEQRKKDSKRVVNKVIRDLIQHKKSL